MAAFAVAANFCPQPESLSRLQASVLVSSFRGGLAALGVRAAMAQAEENSVEAGNGAEVGEVSEPPETLSAPELGAAPQAEPPAALPDAPEAEVVALARETSVFASPSRESKKLGYLRTGARIFGRKAESRGAGCARAWLEIKPSGFVCADETSERMAAHPALELANRPADRSAPLPYVYGKVAAPVPLYARLPAPEERVRFEGRGKGRLGAGWELLPVEPLPEWLRAGRPTPTEHGYLRPSSTLYSTRSLEGSSFAFVRFFEASGGTFGLTPDLLLVPLDRAALVEPPRFRGVMLSEQTQGGAAFAQVGAWLYEDHPKFGLRPQRRLQPREGVALTGEERKMAGRVFFAVDAGGWVRLDQVRRIVKVAPPPGIGQAGRWVAVSLSDQALVAYEGARAIFATLVSTGLELGERSAESPSRATVTGHFRIHTKHVTAKMAGRTPGDEYFLPDVPYVQYFDGSFALHAAYWHDGFGSPKSRGCINLSPADARFLFHWTDPPVPQGWHGAMDAAGTHIWVHD